MERIDIERKRNKRLYLEVDGEEVQLVQEMKVLVSPETHEAVWSVVRIAVPVEGLTTALAWALVGPNERGMGQQVQQGSPVGR